jgi:hypothetical protein
MNLPVIGSMSDLVFDSRFFFGVSGAEEGG